MEPGAERPHLGIGTAIVITVLVILGALFVIQLVVGFLLGLVKLAILVAIVAAVITLLVGRRR